MSESLHQPVKNLRIDLGNFRTVPQPNELAAIQTMISIKPERFWALMDSILDDGYHTTENILVLRARIGKGPLTVKEGNRRIASLKIIHGLVDAEDCGTPIHIVEKIAKLGVSWRRENGTVPCIVFDPGESAQVDKLITLVHGKGDKASRDQWTSVARARHNRDKNGASEAGLDLLEKYIKEGKNLNSLQKERWSGDYPVTVLDEAMQKLAPRIGCTTVRDVFNCYPGKAPNRKLLETILLDIGLLQLGFRELRSAADVLGSEYSVPALQLAAGVADTTTSPVGASSGSGSQATGKGNPTKSRAYASNDVRSVIALLKRFAPHGTDREKLVTLRDEARLLKLAKTPHAFMFILRSMFEISCKAYCKDHKNNGGPSTTNAKGDRSLVDVLRDVCAHLTGGHTDKAKIKTLHGAMTQLAKPDSILSVTSMNQLVHNPKFSAEAGDIATMFGNVFPLLEAMSEK